MIPVLTHDFPGLLRYTIKLRLGKYPVAAKVSAIFTPISVRFWIDSSQSNCGLGLLPNLQPVHFQLEVGTEPDPEKLARSVRLEKKPWKKSFLPCVQSQANKLHLSVEVGPLLQSHILISMPTCSIPAFPRRQQKRNTWPRYGWFDHKTGLGTSLIAVKPLRLLFFSLRFVPYPGYFIF